MLPGVSSYAFGWAVDNGTFTIDDLLAVATHHELPVIQFGDHIALDKIPSKELDTFAEQAKASGVGIETGARGLTLEHLENYLAVSRRLNARLLRFVVDAKGYEPEVDTLIGILREAEPLLSESEITLGIENHDRFPCSVLRRIVDTIDSKYIGICLDTANSLGAGEGIHEVLDALAPVCVNLHLKDYSIDRLPYLMGFTVSGRPLGQGMLPIDQVLTKVTKEGRSQTVVVETWTPPESEMTDTLAREKLWAEESIRMLKLTLNRINFSHT